MGGVAAIILAAGKGTRMKSDLVKVMHHLAGVPMVDWAVDAARDAGATRLVLVVGHHGEKVRKHFHGRDEIVYAEQTEQLGTGHAVACAAEALAGFTGTVLITCGDVPLITAATLRAMLDAHAASGALVTVATTRLANPFGYGRIVRGDDGRILRIVEEKDATSDERASDEINSGIYCADAAFLLDAVTRIGNDNAQQEYYLTDIVPQAVALGGKCVPFLVTGPDEVMGVNDRVQMAEAASVLRQRINEELMLSGVTLIDPKATYIDRSVKIDRDTVVFPNAHISGRTRIGRHCVIEPSAVIHDCTIGSGVKIKAGSVLSDAIVHNEVAVGPMAHLRPGTELMDHVKIGNFVETKKITMGDGSKASHLTYLGDATIGKNVNIGCGTITCNYDGVRKHQTVIGDDVFVGSDVQFVAPITVGRNSLIAAGTTVTQDIPPDSLAIARAPQVTKDGWKLKKKPA